jgi:hypothetical protein
VEASPPAQKGTVRPRTTPRVTSTEVAEALAEAAKEHSTTTLYHGGLLEGGEIQSGRFFSTTTSRDYAEIYAQRNAGQVYKFDIPTARLEEMKRLGQVQKIQDSLEGTSVNAEEWRFSAKFLEEGGAAELKKYIVPPPHPK